MAYVPIEADALGAGIFGNAAAWTTLVDNHDDVYEEYAPPIAGCQADVSIDATVATTVLRFQMPDNKDNEDVNVRVRWKKDAGPTNATLTVLVDGASIGTITTTSTTYTDQTLTGTPTGTGDREIQIQLHRVGGTGGDLVYLEAICINLVPGAPAGGVLNSGFIRADSGHYTADQPVPSERVARLINGPVLIARDRPAVLHTFAQNLEDTAPFIRVTGTAYVPAWRAFVPSAGPSGSIRVYVYLDQVTTGVPDALVTCGGETWNPTGVGWANTTFYVGGGGDTSVTLHLKRSSGSGTVFLGTMQIWREQA